MVYITGDKHAEFDKVINFCVKNRTTKDDIMIILGDAGINYYANELDLPLKNKLKETSITFFAFMEIMKNDQKILSFIKLKNF